MQVLLESAVAEITQSEYKVEETTVENTPS